MEQETIPCKWCNVPTPMLGTKECDNCHEIRTRAQLNVTAAVLIVDHVVDEYYSDPSRVGMYEEMLR
jgi:hypothetical protein